VSSLQVNIIPALSKIETPSPGFGPVTKIQNLRVRSEEALAKEEEKLEESQDSSSSCAKSIKEESLIESFRPSL